MCKIAFNIPNEILYDTRQSEAEALQFARRFTALSYYVYRGVSLGYAAQIADMDKESFIKFLGFFVNLVKYTLPATILR